LAQKRDYYEVLGLQRDASSDQIKAAYRQLARQHHPDANKGDGGAEERFKAINEAYEVLGDAGRRARYDQFGHAGVNGGPEGGGFVGMDPFDLFDVFFGSGRERGRARGPLRGDDLRVDVPLTLEEAAAGVERTVTLHRFETCKKCAGSGAAADSRPEPCSTCRGNGQVRQTQNTFIGSFNTVATCPRCRGEGRVVRNPCQQCSGHGLEQRRASLKVRVPAGIDDGQRLILRGEGDAGPSGGPAGDLVVVARLQPHPVFERHGRDLVCEVTCSMVRAALGGEIQVPTLDGTRPLAIPTGTQPGDVFRVRGAGMPEPNRAGRGDLLVMVKVRVPGQLNDRQRRALEEFAALSGEEIRADQPLEQDAQEHGGLLEWVRNVFAGKRDPQSRDA
jgi:molecular chaperone DnaJ